MQVQGEVISHDLWGAAVTGKDSLFLMRLSPHVKPSVKMTVTEFFDLAGEGKITVDDVLILPGDGTVYVFSDKDTASTFAHDVFQGNDSAALGYPQWGNTTMAVNRDGEVLTEYEDIKRNAENKMLIWGACGNTDTLHNHAQRVGEVIQMAKKKGKGGTGKC